MIDHDEPQNRAACLSGQAAAIHSFRPKDRDVLRSGIVNRESPPHVRRDDYNASFYRLNPSIQRPKVDDLVDFLYNTLGIERS
jgi:hypothetical protein